MSYTIEKVPIDSVLLNPDNPRKIIDEQFEKLKASIARFPKMLQLRPLVVDDKNRVIGGNMRLLAQRRLGITEVYIVRAADLTPEEIREFIVLDNVSFGFMDYDMLANLGYEHDELVSWGMPDFDIGVDTEDKESTKEPVSFTATKDEKKPVLKITFETVADLEAAKEAIEGMLPAYPGAILSVSAGEI